MGLDGCYVLVSIISQVPGLVMLTVVVVPRRSQTGTWAGSVLVRSVVLRAAAGRQQSGVRSQEPSQY